MKKLLKISGIAFLSLLLIALLLPLVFKGKMLRIVKSEINSNLNAKVEFKDISLSLFRHFPKLSVGLENISISGVNEFANDTLISAENIDLSLNLMSLFGGKEMKIYGVYLNSPRIHALVDTNGRANWDIVKEDSANNTQSSETSKFSLALDHYSITNGYIFYKDEEAGMQAEMAGLDHKGRGNFAQDVFTLSTSTSSSKANFTYDKIPYLVNVKAELDAELTIDNRTNNYSFKNAACRVNELNLIADGFFAIKNDSTYNMDISFTTPSTEFRDLISLVPAIYKNDFEKLRTSGTASLKGFIKGLYGPTQLPAYDIDLEIKDGFFQYPQLPKPVKNIQLEANFSNPDGLPDNAVVNIKTGHAEMGTDPFDFRVLFTHPETRKYIDASVKGRLDLSGVRSFIQLSPDIQLSGMVVADAFARGSMSALQQQEGNFNAGGFFTVTEFAYSSQDFPQPVSNGNFKMQIENKDGIADATSIDITSAHMEIGNDPLDFTLKLSHPMSTVDFSGSARGKFDLDKIKQFTTLETGTVIKGSVTGDLQFAGSKAAIDRKDYEQISVSGTAALNSINYVSKEYPGGLNIKQAGIEFSQKQLSITNCAGSFEGTDFSILGQLKNFLGYAFHDEELEGSLDLSAGMVNLDKLIGVDTATSTTAAVSSGPFNVPANINIGMNAKASGVQYDNVLYKNVRGRLLIKDQTIFLQDVYTEALEGSIAFNGSYSTRVNKTNPDISLTYDVKEVNVQKAFYAYNSFQQLMPLGRFLSGKLSSQFSMTGKLKDDMFPDVSSLTGKGNLLLIQGVLSQFKPVDDLANMLQVNELKDVTIRDVKTFFEFTNGKVLVKPFNVKVKDIDMQIGGMHGIDQSMDYMIAMKLPRSYLGSNGNAIVNDLASKAGRNGIPVTLSEYVNLNVKMKGSISRPVIKTDLKESGGDMTKEMKEQAKEFVQQEVQNAKQAVKDSVNTIKNQVVEEGKKELVRQLTGSPDSAKTGFSVDSTKKKAAETLKKTFNGLLKKKN